MNTFEVIKTVRLTEKGTRQGEKYNQYTVVADRRANKIQIRQAVQAFQSQGDQGEHDGRAGKARRKRTWQAGTAPGEKGRRHPQRWGQDHPDVTHFRYAS